MEQECSVSCSILETVRFTQGTPSLLSMNGMFDDCVKLTTIEGLARSVIVTAENLDESVLTDMRNRLRSLHIARRDACDA